MTKRGVQSMQASKRGVIESGRNSVICQKWEESERGWGTRPDGFSLHVSVQALESFLRQVYAARAEVAAVPDEYDRPDGTPYEVQVSEEVYNDLVARGGSRRYFNDYATPAGGIDGWLPVQRGQVEDK